MITDILHVFSTEAENKIDDFRNNLKLNLNFSELEKELRKTLNELENKIIKDILDEMLLNKGFLNLLQQIGGTKALRFKEYREVSILLGNGDKIVVKSPYFLKAASKKGPKKRGPNGRGSHLGLETLGFIDRCSVNLVSEVAESAILCPSFDVAESVLTRRGIRIDTKTIRRICRSLGDQGIAFRGKISLSENEPVAGHTLVIGIDGGRLRQRRNKRGRKKKDQKRQPFHTDWKEPKLFTIFLQDNDGNIVRYFKPLHDATMGDHKAVFALLEGYLKALELSSISRIVFCGDGAPWIWSGVENLLSKFEIDSEKVFQVIDYTHAKQNLYQIIELFSDEERNKHDIDKRWKEMLWKGNLWEIGSEINTLMLDQEDRKQKALKKYKDYFLSHQLKMQYARFKRQCIPCGSGCVESAIRRVINLRLKAPGSFWNKEMAECFLFLRSQLISGRWDFFIKNVSGVTRNLLNLSTINVKKHEDILYQKVA